MTSDYIIHTRRTHHYLMAADKDSPTGWKLLGVFKTIKDANRLKRVAEQCGEIHAKAMIRLTQ